MLLSRTAPVFILIGTVFQCSSPGATDTVTKVTINAYYIYIYINIQWKYIWGEEEKFASIFSPRYRFIMKTKRTFLEKTTVFHQNFITAFSLCFVHKY